MPEVLPDDVHEGLDELGEGSFRTFSKIKKSAKLGPRSSPRVPASVSPSTPAPQHRIRLLEWVMILTDQGLCFWNQDTGRHAGRWRMATCLAGGCGLMANFVDLRD